MRPWAADLPSLVRRLLFFLLVVATGEAPQLGALEGGNLRHAVDYRSLDATALDRWWGVDSARTLNGRFQPLELLRV